MERPKDPYYLAFQQYLRHVNVFRVRIACALSCTLVPLFGFLDYFTAPDHFKELLLVRFVCTGLTFLLFLLSFTQIGRRHINFIGNGGHLLTSGSIALMVRLTGGYESPYYAGLNLVMLAIALLFTWEIKVMAAVCFTIYGFYIIPILLYDDIRNPGILINNNSFLLATLTISLVSAYLIAKLRYKEFESLQKLDESRKQLQESNHKLKQIESEKREFFANISHELKTPLAVIRGEAEVTLRGRDKSVEEYKGVLGYTIELVEQLNKLVADLLFLAQSEAGTIKIEKRDLFLPRIVSDVCREGEILGIRKEVKLSLQHSFNEEMIIYADPHRIKQLFMIIIDNAVNYSKPGGQVKVFLGTEKESAKITITDEGIGIPESSLPRVFDRFYRGEKSRTMAHSGAGLGLSIAKWIVDAHEGHISIESAVGVGTTVTLLFPIVKR